MNKMHKRLFYTVYFLSTIVAVGQGMGVKQNRKMVIDTVDERQVEEFKG